MAKSAGNTFFTEDQYKSDIGLHANENVLERIYGDDISINDKLPVEFFFVTDKLDKAERLKAYLERTFPNYSALKVQPYKELYEVLGTTEPLQMELQTINKWNKIMWNAGYDYDCKLDGWQVGI